MNQNVGQRKNPTVRQLSAQQQNNWSGMQPHTTVPICRY